MTKKKQRAPGTSYGEGSYFQRPDGSWEFAISLGKDANGKRLRRYIRSKSLDVLKKKVSDARARGGGEILSRAREKKPDRAIRTALRPFVDSWLVDIVKPKADSSGATTYETYRIMWESHARSLVGNGLLEEFKGRDVAQLYADMRKAGATPSVIEKTATMLSAAFSYAVKLGEYPGVNPLRLVPRPTYEAKERRSLTAEEARKFIKAAKGDRFELLWLLLLGTGMRLGEALALRWSDVDIAARTIAIRQAIKEGSGPVTLGRTKTGNRRQVRIPAFVVDALKPHRSELRAGKGFMFVTEGGGHPRRSNLRSRHFAPIIEKAGLGATDDLAAPTIHSLRHTAATLALIGGAPAKAVASRLGHSSTRVLAKHYEHLAAGGDAALADLMDAALAPKRKSASR